MSKPSGTDKRHVKQLISNKMRLLDDFGICDRYDKEMIAKLEKVIAEKPDRDPQEVLDYFCRPMIQNKINSWA